MNNFVSWWFSPKFPQKHIENILSYHPKGIFNKIRNLYRTWVVHPIKRRFSKFYLWFLQHFFGLKVIAITGSTGKTTTKEMLASIFGLEGNTIYSIANIDPIYNIPTTILRCKFNTKFLILEMGVEYPKEMDFYLWLARPDIGIITNIYPTHIRYFGSVAGVFKEKSKLVRSLSREKIAVLNFENKFLRELKGIDADIVWFGENSENNATNIKFTSDFKTKFTLNINRLKADIALPIVGKQFVIDAVGAAAAADCLGVGMKKIKKGLETYVTQEHRMNIKRLRSGAILLDDSYNNNPEAAKMAINTLSDFAKKKKKTVLVFGDMLELGKDEIKYHKEIGRVASEVGIDYVIGIGSLSKFVVKNISYSVATWQEAVAIIKPLLEKDTIILVKGSRGIGLDNIVNILT